MNNIQVSVIDICYLKDKENLPYLHKKDLYKLCKKYPEAVFGAIKVNDCEGNLIDGRNGYWIEAEYYDWLSNDDGTERWADDEDITVGYLVSSEYDEWWEDLSDSILGDDKGFEEV